MAKVTYLFGAGASRGVLPIVSELPIRLHDFKLVLERLVPEAKFREIRDHLINDIEWLLTQLVHDRVGFVPRQSSIDTYAKRLFIRNEVEQLKKLKLVTSLFFMFEQNQKGVDQRYDSFFASIIKRHATQLPESIKIISWNYDSQFEQAYSVYSGDENISRNQDKLGIFTKNIVERIEKTGGGFVPESRNGFSILKINGSASLFHSSTGKEEPHYAYPTIYEAIFQRYSAVTNGEYENALSFCWEEEYTSLAYAGIIDFARKAAEDTEALVVIGYSFPFFNREVDQLLINSMKKLKRVYIQDPNPQGVEERFLAHSPLQNLTITLKDDTSQFYLPNELTL